MDATLQALGGILLNAVPTFLIVVILHFYLKAMFFRPMAQKLQERYQATEGARKMAEQSLLRAEAKSEEYETALRAARSEVYQIQEKLHKELAERHSQDLAVARDRATASIKQAQAELAKDVETAKASLSRDSEVLAAQIADSILRRSAA